MSHTKSSRRHAFAWLLFGAGGTLTALLFPALLVGGLVLSLSEPSVARESVVRIASFLEAPWVRWGVVVLVTFAHWHAAHRIGLLLHDLHLPVVRRVLAPLLYAFAAASAPIAAVLLH